MEFIEFDLSIEQNDSQEASASIASFLDKHFNKDL